MCLLNEKHLIWSNERSCRFNWLVSKWFCSVLLQRLNTICPNKKFCVIHFNLWKLKKCLYKSILKFPFVKEYYFRCFFSLLIFICFCFNEIKNKTTKNSVTKPRFMARNSFGWKKLKIDMKISYFLITFSSLIFMQISKEINEKRTWYKNEFQMKHRYMQITIEIK